MLLVHSFLQCLARCLLEASCSQLFAYQLATTSQQGRGILILKILALSIVATETDQLRFTKVYYTALDRSLDRLASCKRLPQTSTEFFKTKSL